MDFKFQRILMCLFMAMVFGLFMTKSFAGVTLVQSFTEENIAGGNTSFGRSVSSAGDVNNDGYDDVIVGAAIYSSYTGRSYIYFGGSSMDNTADVTMTGEEISNNFGCSVSGAGDVNNDGYDDVIVGAWEYSSTTGRVYIYYGGSSMDNTADVTMTGETTGNWFGYSVSGAGDMNNDGYDDVIVGAYYYNSNTGRVYIYFGGSSMDNTADVTMTGETSGDEFGNSVSCAGDVNNDGYDDVIVGARFYNSSTGRAYVYYGGSLMDNTADVTMTGEATDDRFGCSVSFAGDVNDDGYDDVIVGANGYSTSTGRAYVFYGGSSMDNTADVTMTGEVTGNGFGGSVSGTGDVNNDGYDDVIVGARFYNSSTGRAYVYYGGSLMDNTADVTMTGEAADNRFGGSVSGAGDVNNDGYEDVIVGASGYSMATGRAYVYYSGSSMDNTADITMEGEVTSNYFGFSVSGAGDVNNDSYDDVIVGATGYSSNTGRAYIYYGSSSMDNTADVNMTGEIIGNEFGRSVSGAGDVNNDGYDDVIVGAYRYSSNTGRAYVYFGGSSMDNTADVTMTGEATDNYFGCSVSGAGDVNNDGYDDVIIGAEYYFMTGPGRAYVYFGDSSMDNTADVTMTGEATIDKFGCSVSGAGDVNNDGYDDVIVGAWVASSGRVYIYYGGSSMDNTADVTMNGEGMWINFGRSVSGAGDVNNDTYDDVIVGAQNYSSQTGRAYVYFGGSSMDNTADVTMTGEATLNYFGCSVSGAGDVNNDGYDDVIVGAYNYSSRTGRAYVYYGSSSMDNIADVVMTGEASGNEFGVSVSGAGDVNNDGTDDIIIGAYNYGEKNNGKAYIYKYSSSTCLDFTFSQQGWYMISLPVIPEDSSVSILFPTALGSMAFGWDPVGGAYSVETEIKTKYGYWIAIPGATTDQVCGGPLNSYTIHCGTQGWYMIGSVLGGADFTNPDDNPDNQVLSPAFGWDTGTGSYYTTTTLEEKNGYWAAVFGACDLTVGGGGSGSGLSKSLNEVNWSTFSRIYGSTPPEPPGLDESTGELVQIPTEYGLSQNAPNPFNPETTIRYQLPENRHVSLIVYNMRGQEVKRLIDGNVEAGFHEVVWDGRSELGDRVGSGLYVVRLKAGQYVKTRKLLLVQ